jgi:hypothetical protein
VRKWAPATLVGAGYRGPCGEGGWDRFRSFGPLPNARFDHHTEPPGIQERAILYAAVWQGAVATSVAEAFRETRRRDPQLAAFSLASGPKWRSWTRGCPGWTG